jgi:hypothetical protein
MDHSLPLTVHQGSGPRATTSTTGKVDHNRRGRLGSGPWSTVKARLGTLDWGYGGSESIPLRYVRSGYCHSGRALSAGNPLLLPSVPRPQDRGAPAQDTLGAASVPHVHRRRELRASPWVTLTGPPLNPCSAQSARPRFSMERVASARRISFAAITPRVSSARAGQRGPGEGRRKSNSGAQPSLVVLKALERESSGARFPRSPFLCCGHCCHLH